MPSRALQAAMFFLLMAVGPLACSSGADKVDSHEPSAEQQSLTTAVYQIDCGGGAVSPFAADQFATGGNTYDSGKVVATAGVTNAAPAAVYRTERVGNHSYTFGSLTPSASYTVRLHFAEIWFTSSGARTFNVLINGTQVLTKLDIFASAGATKALVRDFTATATSAGQITIQYVSVVDNAKSSGIEILTGSGSSSPTNQAPTVATPAAANPNPTTGTTSTLSVLGADDGGEANLTYTWATTGTPPGTVSFSANASNAAKNTVATFSRAGSYSLAVTITDASASTATSSLNVVVNSQTQTLTSITVSPATTQVPPNGTQSFAAVAYDQSGNPLTAQPSFAWTATGGGSVSSSGLFTAGSSSGGPYSVTATSAGKGGSASVTVAASTAFYAPYQIDCGGAAVSPFAADQFFSGGSTYDSGKVVSTTGVANAAPAAVYRTERVGNHSYTFGSLTPGAVYTVRLHFAEIWYTTTGSRTFNVLVNGTQVLTKLDIVAAAGANTALVRDFPTAATSAGQITIQYVNVVDNAKSSGIEIISSSGPPNQAPTVATAAAGSPNPTTGTTSSLSVLGTDDGGEANLTYTWATAGTPPGTVSFSANGSNAAKNTVATFGQAGNYSLIVTIRDQSGLSVTSSVGIGVNTSALPSSGCGLSGKPTGDLHLTTKDGNGVTRDFETLVPTSYDPSVPLAVTLVYHGANATSADAKAFNVQAAPGAAAASIFVFPQGVAYQSFGIGWDDTCAGYDMPFFDNMLASLQASYCIDLKRVYVAGFSWGCDHVTSLACCRGNKIRAIAAASCSDEFSDPNNYQTYQAAAVCPVTNNAPIRFTHATNGDNGYPAPLFATTSALYRSFNGCSATFTPVSPSPCNAYQGCRVPVVECAYDNLGHAIPAGWGNDSWSFFTAH